MIFVPVRILTIAQRLVSARSETSIECLAFLGDSSEHFRTFWFQEIVVPRERLITFTEGRTQRRILTGRWLWVFREYSLIFSLLSERASWPNTWWIRFFSTRVCPWRSMRTWFWPERREEDMSVLFQHSLSLSRDLTKILWIELFFIDIQ